MIRFLFRLKTSHSVIPALNYSKETLIIQVALSIFFMATLMLLAPEVLAQDVPAEWSGPWCRTIKLLTGPIAIGLLVAATVVAGLLFALGEAGSSASRAAGLVLGGTLAVSAPALVKFIKM